ncbi:Flp pilus assembly protein CpaB [Vibrio sp. JC009]|uniref:Flp pilus assembly protein CpaB n=1 Tax=Vibrio sp. JC009 TaxID=2912314 RepID=UPI0023B0BE0A|nr:Flp pilus assembly protein CpaB [Vibrio sp. JC009]WED22296.1 Flp pilus assembly protein CpaB [Vibrio sp. JC009]
MNSKLIFVIACIAITAGIYGISGNITAKKQEQPVDKPVAKEKTISVWRAKENLIKGARISRDDLKIVEISETKARESGIKKSFSIDFKKHWYLNRSVNSDELIYSEDLVKPGDDGYLSLVVNEGFAPYNLSLSTEAIIGGSISIGDLVDISTVSSSRQNLSQKSLINDVNQLELTLLISQAKVLNIVYPKQSKRNKKPEVILTLEVTNRQLAKLSIAKRIAEVEVHKSVPGQSAQLYADSGDVIHSSAIRTVREFRSSTK